MNNAKIFYENNIKKNNILLEEVEKKLKIYSSIRLIIAISVVIEIYYFYKNNSPTLMALVSTFLIGLFVIIAFYHGKELNKKKEIELILKFNKDGIKRINGQWKAFKDKGSEYLDINHSFINDLDIFGNNSLFQWLNITNTEFGRKALVKMLKLEENKSKLKIENKQKAIKELSKKPELIEKIYIKSFNDKKNMKDVNLLIDWFKSEKEISKTVKYVPYLFIISTFAFILLAILGRIPASYLLIIFMINYLVVKLLTRNLSEAILILTNSKSRIIKYSDILESIEQETFESEQLKDLKNRLYNNEKNFSVEMKNLKNIINWLGDSNGNAYYLIINVLILSDVFILANLEEWRNRNGKNLEEWLNIMGEFEALLSLSNFAFNHSEWTYPEITDKKELIAVEVSHPMLAENAVANTFTLNNQNKAALITGSNMSGKSTFLRTLGLNIILSYQGLPTLSKSFKCGIYDVYTCMRTQDNLEESISSFYAEILRIKILIEAAKKGEKVFFLLDEIFKGTNSKDRHDGAKILIQQLVKNGGVGLVSTHDLELCDMEKENNWLINFNFQEYYDNNNIKFDYKLKNGISKTQNAKYLMKLAGIEIS